MNLRFPRIPDSNRWPSRFRQEMSSRSRAIWRIAREQWANLAVAANRLRISERGTLVRRQLAAGTRKWTKMWQGLELSRQFLVASTIVILTCMAIVGSWLAGRIEHTVSQNSALETALYVESFVGERIQSLVDRPEFDPEVQSGLEQLVLETPLGRRIVSFKVWSKSGRVMYASPPEHVGKVYERTDNLNKAWDGTVSFEFDELHDHEDEVERKFDVPLLEIYVPVRKRFGGDVIAVVEFYEDATKLARDISEAQRQAWILLAVLGTSVVAALYGMAVRASRTIEHQRSALQSRVQSLSNLLDQNLTLKKRLETSSRRSAALNERYIRRIGADLHDGPAQLVSIALLRLDATRPAVSAGAAANPKRNAALPADDKTKIREVLREALNDIRSISSGLSLPELDVLTVEGTIKEAISAHEQRTQTTVLLKLGKLPEKVDREVGTALYRFLQETLNNTHRHAPLATVTVSAHTTGDDAIVCSVADDGPGFVVDDLKHSGRLGLFGLKARLECIGGELEILSQPGKGTTVTARMPQKTESTDEF